MNKFERFLELHDQCPIENTDEYHLLAIELALELCATLGWDEVHNWDMFKTIGTESGRIKSTSENESTPYSK